MILRIGLKLTVSVNKKVGHCLCSVPAEYLYCKAGLCFFFFLRLDRVFVFLNKRDILEEDIDGAVKQEYR